MFGLPTPLILGLLGGFGILLHNLVKLNEINRKYDGIVNMQKYWALERFSIAISVCVVIVCLIAREEVKQLEAVGNWLGLSFVAIGYSSQSILSKYIGKAEKLIDSDK